MAASTLSSSSAPIGTTTHRTHRHHSPVALIRTKYHWPPLALNFWLLIMLIGSSCILGIFSYLLTVQSALRLTTPWYFPYWITVAALSDLFIIIMLFLIAKRQLLPGIVMLGAFILFVLWMVGLCVVSSELWGGSGNVNSSCELYVNGMERHGASLETLAWLEQRTICQDWVAGFAWMVVGVVFLLWMMVMSFKVYRDD